MIIYGWDHFNRRERTIVRAACPKCRARGYRRSYTRTHFITLYFLPVIPIGRQRAVCECPKGKQALGMPYRARKGLRAVSVPKTATDYEADPTNPEKAPALVETIARAQDRAALAQVARRLAAAFLHNSQCLVSRTPSRYPPLNMSHRLGSSSVAALGTQLGIPHALAQAAHACQNLDTQFLYLRALALRHPDAGYQYIEQAAALQKAPSFHRPVLERPT